MSHYPNMSREHWVPHRSLGLGRKRRLRLEAGAWLQHHALIQDSTEEGVRLPEVLCPVPTEPHAQPCRQTPPLLATQETSWVGHSTMGSFQGLKVPPCLADQGLFRAETMLPEWKGRAGDWDQKVPSDNEAQSIDETQSVQGDIGSRGVSVSI